MPCPRCGSFLAASTTLSFAGTSREQEGTIAANREAVDEWQQRLPEPWTTELEATMLTSWIYDHLMSHEWEMVWPTTTVRFYRRQDYW